MQLRFQAFIKCYYSFEENIDFKVFESWLRNRHNHNVALRQLTLIACFDIGDPEVQSLRRLVDDPELVDMIGKHSMFFHWIFPRPSLGPTP